MVPLIHRYFSIHICSSINVFSYPYEFLITFFSPAYVIVRIQYITHTHTHTHKYVLIDCWLLVRLLVHSRLLAVKSLASKLYSDF